MMGDTVNLAARLEASAKQYGIYTQISEDTYEPVKERTVVRELDFVQVVGKTLPVKTYELISLRGEEPETYKTLIPEFQGALETYREQRFKKAKKMFIELEKIEEAYDGRIKNPSLVYAGRCEHFINSPPEEDWDGAWVLQKK
jgi:adenylate cyclase